VEAPRPQAKFFHVYPDVNELGRVYQPDVAINATAAAFLTSLVDVQLENRANWADWTRRGRQAYLHHSTLIDEDDSFTNEKVISWLQSQLSPDTIITSGSGINTGVLHRFHRYGAAYRTQLAPIAGSMGYGFPAAISAKLCAPEREVICISGDGCFMMTAQEMATAAMLELNITVIVINNGILGTIRKHQEREYPERVIATDLLNPDFAKLAESFGAIGLSAASMAQFATAFERAIAHRGLSLIDVQVDRQRYISSLVA